MGEEAHHTYEYETNLEGGSSPAKLLRMVGKNKRVLEIGAGPGSITKHMTLSGNCEVVALEIDEEAIIKLSPFCEKVFQADLNDLSWPELLKNEKKFDVVVIADVLEHVYDPWTTLKLIPELLNDKGYIVVSLPHAGHSAILASLLSENFEYGNSGLLDKTHIRFFGLKNMQALFNETGLDIDEAQYVIIPPELTELSAHWKALNTETRKTLSSYKHGDVYQVVIKAIPNKRASKNIDLMSNAVEKLSMGKIYFLQFKSVVKSLLPKRYYEKLKSKARKIGIKGY